MNILTPQDELQLKQIIADARAQKNSLKISGGGTRSGLGGAITAETTLSLKAMNGVNLYDPGALTLVAKAGTTMSEIETLLASEGQRLAFEPMDHRAIYNSDGEPTIGGIVACNISGSRRIQSGACRDALIGVRYICGNGEIVKNGGRVMKNVTGLDLVKLMAGSYGTLGILTEVAFKVLPSPARQATLVLNGLSVEQAVKAMSKGLCSPFEVTGAAHLPHADQTLLRIEGFDSQVTYRLQKLAELVGQDATIEGDDHNDLWRSIRNVEMFTNQDSALWRLSIKPSDAIEINRILSEQTDAELMFDWGGGLVWAQLPNTDNAQADIVRGAVAKLGGHATLVRASNAVKAQVPVFQPQSSSVAKLSSLIRQKFDPAGILNAHMLAEVVI